MGKHFFAKSKDGKIPTIASYSGEPLEKFKERLTKKGVNVNEFDFSDPEGVLTDRGMEIVSQIMQLVDSLSSEIKPKDVHNTEVSLISNLAPKA